MSIYSNRMDPAYRPFTGTLSPLIAEWWNAAHDAVIEICIAQYQWHWSWNVAAAIQQCNERDLPAVPGDARQKAGCSSQSNAIMYHAQYRATQLGLKLRIRTPQKKTCPLCQQEFMEDSLPQTFTARLGFDRLNFCSPCLNDRIGWGGRDGARGRDEILGYLRAVAEALGRVPAQGFEEGESVFSGLSDRQRLALLQALHGRPSIRSVKQQFGSWFNALCQAGLLPDGTRRMVIGTQCRADDGHMCLSLAEKTIDDFMFARGIVHEKEPKYPEGNYRADFAVGDVFIEYFGLAGDPAYDEKAKAKRAVAKRHGIRLIELYPKDLASLTVLETKIFAGIGIR